MGNQVCCPFCEQEDENLLYRIAYSFSSGDAMTLVIGEDGNVRSRWGKLRTGHIPNQERVLRLVRNLTAFYRNQAKPYLINGRMIHAPTMECDTVAFSLNGQNTSVKLPAVLCTAWEAADGSEALILVNPADCETRCRINGKQIAIPALNAVMVRVL